MARETDATAKQPPDGEAADQQDSVNDSEGIKVSGVSGGEDAAEEAPPQSMGLTRVAELMEEVAGLKDRLLRAVAESDNARRRAEKERQDTAKYAVSNFARDLLPVADNLRRALDALPQAEGSAGGAEAVRVLITGVEATERQLLAAFDRVGIKRMQPLGQPFDPNFHRVMQEIDSPTHAPGTVVQVMQAGYTIQERLLREAMVVISKGEAKSRVDTSA